MQFRRTPTRARVAAEWLRRARDTRPSGGDTRFDEFLKDMGNRKVRAPGHDGEVTINYLKSTGEASDTKRVQEEYAKWSGGDDDDTTDGRGVGVIDSPQKLKAVQDDLVEDAVNFGVPEATAREMVRGLVVGDDDSSVVLVERNLQRAIDKAVGDKQKADADAAEKEKAKKDKEDAEARDKLEREEAEAETKREQLEILNNKQDKLVENAVRLGVSEEEARELVKDLSVDSTDEDFATVWKEIKNQGIRNRATMSAQAVDDAKAALAAAERKTKGKNKKRNEEIDQAIRKSKSDLLKAEDAHYWATIEADRLMGAERDSAIGVLRSNASKADENLDAAVRDFDAAKARYEEASASGDVDAAAQAEADATAAGELVQTLDKERRKTHRELSKAEAAASKDTREKAQEAFNKARERYSQGMVLFNANGEMVRYDPSKKDAIYEALMTLLGEQLDRRPLPEIESSRERYTDTDKDGIPDFEDSDPKVKYNGKAKKDVPLKPTKSGKPRNPDGSSQKGGETTDYGPHEFWMVNPTTWSAKDGRGNARTFPTMDGAKAYAKTASTPTSRVASRYMLRYWA